MLRIFLYEIYDGEFKCKEFEFWYFIFWEFGVEFFFEVDRYYLYIFYVCLWVLWCFVFLKFKGFDYVIGVIVMKLKWGEMKFSVDDYYGWMFFEDGEDVFGVMKDFFNNVKFI